MRARLPILLVALTTAGFTSACTRPAVAPKPLAFQQSADALRDWQAVAKQIALDMQRDGFLPGRLQSSAAAPRQPYYIHVATARSQFLHEVAQSLKGEVLAHGGAVARTPFGAAEIDLDVDVVRWPPRDRVPDGTGTLTGLASGAAVVLANQSPLTPAAGFGLLAGAGILADVLRTMTPNTDTEIAWGAAITIGNQVVFDVRYPMYVADGDTDLYVGPPPPQVVQLRYAP